MQQLLRKRGVQRFVAGGLAAGLFAAGAAWAGGLAPPVKVSGGAQTKVKVAQNEESWGPSEVNTWMDVPGSRLTFEVPKGGRTITAFFSAESTCTATSWCSVRLVARRGDGAIVELHPRAGNSYAFDDANSDSEVFESNARGGSLRLAKAGTWKVWVQGQLFGNGSMVLDDWYFQVNVHK